MSKPDWKVAKEFEDITYKKCNGVARIAFNRPNVRNAFRPKTTKELYEAFYDAGEDTSIGVVLLSAEGPSTKDGVYSFCSGGKSLEVKMLNGSMAKVNAMSGVMVENANVVAADIEAKNGVIHVIDAVIIPTK